MKIHRDYDIDAYVKYQINNSTREKQKNLKTIFYFCSANLRIYMGLHLRPYGLFFLPLRVKKCHSMPFEQ